MLLGISGELNSGKDTVGKMVQYYFSKQNHNPFSLNECLNGYVKNADSIDIENKFLHGYLKTQSLIEIKKYSAKLKQMLTILVGCELEDWESQEFKNTVMPDWLQGEETVTLVTNGYKTYPKRKTNRTYRWLIQNVGTEFFRNGINQEVWINALFSEYLPERLHHYYAAEYVDMETEIDFSTKLPNWLITDVRFINEADAIKRRDGFIVKVIRNKEQSNSIHSSETELSKIKADFIITNFSGLVELYSQVELMIRTLKLSI